MAGRRPKSSFKHNASLQALALRERKVYVANRPELPSTTTSIFLDIEGVPDADFYYLAGVKLTEDGDSTVHSFWANSKEDEAEIWRDLLSFLEHLDNYTIYHYGTYERKFLDKMKARYPNSTTDDQLVARFESSLVDVHALIYGRVYFPVYSQTLKEIGGLLGAEWPHDIKTGAQSLVYRHWWEQGHDPEFRKALIDYNQDDCNALHRVADCLRAIGLESSSFGPLDVAATESAPDHPARRLGRRQFANPDIKHVIDCAYFDYQRKKVFFRTDDAVKRSLRRQQKQRKKVTRVNQVVDCRPRTQCPFCQSRSIRQSDNRTLRKTIKDLRFTPSGVKRWVVQYATKRYRCRTCKRSFLSDEYPRFEGKVGHNLSSWAMYSHFALRQSVKHFAEATNDVFGYTFADTILSKIKPRMAKRYMQTQSLLRNRLLESAACYVDESKMRFRSKVGYVWVFTNLEEVLYVFSPTREGKVVESTLEGFTGTVVSDFYCGYDSLEYPQQKCLVHLIRDINDDLMANPFDAELEALACMFTSLMIPIIETTDRFGLKRHFLKKHERRAAKFLTEVNRRQYTSEPAKRYQKRFRKYGDRMFTFLSKEGVAWNNNAAENALKLFSSRWRLVGPGHTESSIKDYLLFLSIYGTLRRKGGSFLRFLLSGELDIDKFLRK